MVSWETLDSTYHSEEGMIGSDLIEISSSNLPLYLWSTSLLGSLIENHYSWAYLLHLEITYMQECP